MTAPPGQRDPAGGEAVSFSHRAMACIFEIRLAGVDESYARDAASAAFAELDRIEKLLSRFEPYGDVGRINAAPAGEPVVVELETEQCLLAARRMWLETLGAFDPTAGPPPVAGGPDAGRRIDAGLVRIDEDEHTVTRLDAAVQLDLGGIGKGFGLDRMAEVLEQWEITCGLLHGGTSTVLALGPPPGRSAWRADLSDPLDRRGRPLGSVRLAGRAMSASATTDRRHITAPRTGEPAPADRAAWATAETAADADALTTALCVMEAQDVRQYIERHPDCSCLLAVRRDGRWRMRTFGREIAAAEDGRDACEEDQAD